jgi:ferredoxin
MALQEHTRIKQTLTEKAELEIQKPRKPLPMWCRGIMSGCVNCGGCV